MRIQFRKFNRVQAVLFLLVPALVFIIGALILEGNFVSQASAAVANSPEPPLQKYMPPPPPTRISPPPNSKLYRQGAISRKSTAKSNTKPSKILTLPFPEHLECVNQSGPACKLTQVCPLISDPVHDKDGKFYPSPCWAEAYGIMEYQSGNSAQLQKFIRDLWYTPKSSPISQSVHNHGLPDTKAIDPSVEFFVPNPSIEFTYFDSDFSKGPALRSRVWQGNTAFSDLIYYFSDQSTKYIRRSRMWPTTGRKKTLLVFLNFSKAFPEKAILDFSKIYNASLNNYFKQNQNISDPIQYDFTTLVLDPPDGISEQSLLPHSRATLTVDDIQAETIYKAALDKLNLIAPQDFDMLVWVPITDTNYSPGGTYFGGRIGLAARKLGAGRMSWLWAGLFSQGRTLSSDKPTQSDQLFFLNQFNNMFGTLSHEIMHGLGMQHTDLEQSPRDLIQYQPQTQTIAVGEQPGVMFSCDNFGKYLEQSAAEAIKLPPEFSIQVGNEPAGQIVPSQSGACFYANNGPSFKDVDKDGTYELIYLPESISQILKNLQGWTDLDGDGIAEIVDPTPYGGLKVLNPPGLEYARTLGPASFTPIKEVRVKNCRFQKIKLSTGQTGLLPLSCPEFNSIRTDVYKGLQYYWTVVKKSYGLVLIAKQ